MQRSEAHKILFPEERLSFLDNLHSLAVAKLKAQCSTDLNLREVPVLAACGDSFIELLAKEIQERVYLTNTRIITEGDRVANVVFGNCVLGSVLFLPKTLFTQNTVCDPPIGSQTWFLQTVFWGRFCFCPKHSLRKTSLFDKNTVRDPIGRLSLRRTWSLCYQPRAV